MGHLPRSWPDDENTGRPTSIPVAADGTTLCQVRLAWAHCTVRTGRRDGGMTTAQVGIRLGPSWWTGLGGPRYINELAAAGCHRRNSPRCGDRRCARPHWCLTSILSLRSPCLRSRRLTLRDRVMQQRLSVGQMTARPRSSTLLGKRSERLHTLFLACLSRPAVPARRHTKDRPLIAVSATRIGLPG